MKTISNPTYVLRTCDSNLQGYVEAPDWNPEPVCGGGFHGLLMGKGSSDLLDWGDEAIWQVIEVQEDTIVWIGNDQVKFPYGNVIYSGNRKDATDLLISLGADKTTVPGAFQNGGLQSNLTGGDYSTLRGGDFSNVQGGDNANLISGRGSAIRGGNFSILRGGDRSNFKAGKNSCFIGSYWKDGCERFVTAYVGEDGIKANTWYWFQNCVFTEIVGK